MKKGVFRWDATKPKKQRREDLKISELNKREALTIVGRKPLSLSQLLLRYYRTKLSVYIILAKKGPNALMTINPKECALDFHSVQMMMMVTNFKLTLRAIKFGQNQILFVTILCLNKQE